MIHLTSPVHAGIVCALIATSLATAFASAAGQSTSVSSSSFAEAATPGTTCVSSNGNGGVTDYQTGANSAGSSASCLYGPATARAFAWGDHGTLHAFATASGAVAKPAGGGASIGASAVQGFQDVMHINGVAPSFFRFYILTNGTMAAQSDQGQVAGVNYATNAESEAWVSLNAYEGTSSPLTAASITRAIVSQGAASYQGESPSGPYIGTLFYGFVDVPYEYVSSIPFAMQMGVQASVSNLNDADVEPSVMGQAFSDFGGTGHLAGIDAFDANGNSVIQQANVTFASGAQYFLGTPSVTTTPEPSSVALLGTGLLGLAPLTRRRRS